MLKLNPFLEEKNARFSLKTDNSKVFERENDKSVPTEEVFIV